MAARKLANEVERCFKKVDEGVALFEGIHDKIQQCTNPSQKEKQEDSLKKEIKKLQRHRDQIKAWAAMNEIKDKKPLLDKRKLIETQMEKFKAVEKEMKTKAYSKEGLQLASKMDPKERERLETGQFLQSMVEQLERQIEEQEAEQEVLQVQMKKSKKDTSKAERIGELERQVERHKWHVSRLELLQRALDNEKVDVEQVKDLEDSIKYYVESNQEVDFMEDEEMYDDLNLDEEEDLYGMANDVDRVSSQDTQSVAEEPEADQKAGIAPGKQKGVAASDASGPTGRRHSAHMKSPIPALATLHVNLPSVPQNGVPTTSMKPAAVPARPAGEPLRYASAAAAAAATDKNGVGIAPLPPPPGAAGLAPLPSAKSATASPSAAPSQPARPMPTQQTSSDSSTAPQLPTKSPALSHASAAAPSSAASSIPATPAMEKVDGASTPNQRPEPVEETPRPTTSRKPSGQQTQEEAASSSQALTNGNVQNGVEDDISVYHLPSSLKDLLGSFEAMKADVVSSKPVDEHMLAASYASLPDAADAERPRHYTPQVQYPYMPPSYPQEPSAVFDDPKLYSKIDTDGLFYLFYYRQGTYQQYLAAKALKSQSWRFHKQYQTWFQRHEEPKQITEDFEQGTYRFFDYESTWMNRRKQDFKFAYKFLEDDVL